MINHPERDHSYKDSEKEAEAGNCDPKAMVSIFRRRRDAKGSSPLSPHGAILALAALDSFPVCDGRRLFAE